jgi:type I restriction enzyme R subunit
MLTEANTVEQMVLDACVALGWRFVPAPMLPRQPSEVFVESLLLDSVIKLNPEIAVQPDRADEVIYKLRAIMLTVQNDGLVRSNEALAKWLQGDKTMPFGPNGELLMVPWIAIEPCKTRNPAILHHICYFLRVPFLNNRIQHVA